MVDLATLFSIQPLLHSSRESNDFSVFCYWLIECQHTEEIQGKKKFIKNKDDYRKLLGKINLGCLSLPSAEWWIKPSVLINSILCILGEPFLGGLCKSVKR